jgi:hypothetical protein
LERLNSTAPKQQIRLQMNYSSKDKTIKAPGKKTPRSGLFGTLELQDIICKKKKSFGIVLVPNSQAVAKIDCGYRYLYS